MATLRLVLAKSRSHANHETCRSIHSFLTSYSEKNRKHTMPDPMGISSTVDDRTDSIAIFPLLYLIRIQSAASLQCTASLSGPAARSKPVRAFHHRRLSCCKGNTFDRNTRHKTYLFVQSQCSSTLVIDTHTSIMFWSSIVSCHLLTSTSLRPEESKVGTQTMNCATCIIM